MRAEKAAAPGPAGRKFGLLRPAVLLIAVGTLVVIGANAHLLYVAITSQPECVAHSRTGETGPGLFSAAKSAC